jgi:hypothetical protein
MSSVVKLQKGIMNDESRKKNPNIRIKKVYHVVAEEDTPRVYNYSRQPYSPLPPIHYRQLPSKCNCPECNPYNYYPPSSPHCNCAQCRANREYYMNQYRPQTIEIPTPRYQIVESKPLSQISTAYRRQIDSPTPKTSLPPINRSTPSVLQNSYNDFEPGNSYANSFNRVIFYRYLNIYIQLLKILFIFL